MTTSNRPGKLGGAPQHPPLGKRWAPVMITTKFHLQTVFKMSTSTGINCPPPKSYVYSRAGRHLLKFVYHDIHAVYVSWYRRCIGNTKPIHLRVQHYNATDLTCMGGPSRYFATSNVTLTCSHVILSLWSLKNKTRDFWTTFDTWKRYTLVSWYWLSLCTWVLIVLTSPNVKGIRWIAGKWRNN